MNGSKCGNQSVYVRLKFCILHSAFCILNAGALHAQSYQDCVERGLALMQADSLVEAEQAFWQAMTISPAIKSNALLFRHIGQIQEHQGRQQEALESYTLGLNISPGTLGLLLDRAALYIRLDNLDRALSDYNNVLDLRADHTEALFFRAYILTEKRLYKQARADYEALIRLKPDYLEARIALVMLNQRDNRPREATEQIDALIQAYPRNATLYTVRGGMELDRRQYETALYDFDKAIQLDPNNPDHYLSRAECYTAMRKKKQARADLQRALTLGADPQTVAQQILTL